MANIKSIGIFLGVDPSAGGMFQYAETLLNALKIMHGQGYQIQVAYISSNWEKTLFNYPFNTTRIMFGEYGLRLAGLVMISLMPGPVARMFSGIFNPIVKQIVRIHCEFWIFPAQDALSYQIDLPVVTTIHDLMHRYESSFPEVSKRGRWLIREHRFRNLASHAQAILVDSSIGCQHVVESYGVNPNKIFVLPYVAPSHIVNVKDPKGFDKRYSLPAKFIFYPAQFWAHKNHKRLIVAASEIKAKYPDISLVFTGEKSKAYEDVKEFVSEQAMDREITFMGYVPDIDLAGFYRRARAMMMPTFFGPTNIPPLEAFSCGCPIAVSNVYGMPEQVGEAALLFDPLSVDEITDAMEKLWTDDDLCFKLTAKGYEKTKRWNQKQFSEKLKSILDEVDRNLSG